MGLPQRKEHRLAGYDYSSPGGYFITICTKDKRNLFWASNQLVNDYPILTPTGKIVLRCIQSIPILHPDIQLSLFNIMPNHIHLILEIHAPKATSIRHIIGQMKRSASMQAGFPIWQRNYYDHIIRNDVEYQNVWRYVENNHWKWREDCYHSPDDESLPFPHP